MSDKTSDETGTETKAPAYDWEALLPSTDAPARVVGTSTKVDVMEEIPATIRLRLEESLLKFVTSKTEWAMAGKELKNFRPSWRVQPVGSEEMGKELKRLMTRYAKYRPEHWETRDARTPTGQITVRTGVPTLYDKHPETGAKLETPFWGLRYSARPVENKETKRAPGSAK